MVDNKTRSLIKQLVGQIGKLLETEKTEKEKNALPGMREVEILRYELQEQREALKEAVDKLNKIIQESRILGKLF